MGEDRAGSVEEQDGVRYRIVRIVPVITVDLESLETIGWVPRDSSPSEYG
jgi:hypothetical protein